jgi:hypothetical protein
METGRPVPHVNAMKTKNFLENKSSIGSVISDLVGFNERHVVLRAEQLR